MVFRAHGGPYLGWGIGVVLLWRSRTWRTVDKLIGTLAPPLGGLVTLTVLRIPAYAGSSASINGVESMSTMEALLPLAVIVLMWIAAALPFATFTYLLIRASILRRALPAAAPAGGQSWYTILTAVLVAVGGIIVPLVGWVVGVALLWNSTVWTRRDKVVGTLLWPLLAAVIVGVAAAVGSMPTSGQPYTLDEPVNPLVPVLGSYVHWAVLASAAMVPIVVLAYLLVRAKRLRS